MLNLIFRKFSPSSSSTPIISVIFYQLINHLISPASTLDNDRIINKSNESTMNCNLKTYILYSGYEYISNDERNSIQSNRYECNLYECLNLCIDNDHCNGINHDGHQCQLIIDNIIDDDSLIQSNKTSINVFGKKICISDNYNRCKNKQWAFESVIGYTINYPIQKFLNNNIIKKVILKNIHSILKCNELCLNWIEFNCRSIIYNEIDKNCILFNIDRDTLIDDSNRLKNRNEIQIKFLKTNPFIEQIFFVENKCQIEPEKKFCDLKKLSKYRLKTYDYIQTNVSTLMECKDICLSSICKSFQYDFFDKICRISHLNEISTTHFLQQPYIFDDNIITYEISTCFNVTVLCQSKSMNIQIEASKLFSGKIYAQNQPKTCFNNILNQFNFNLSLPYIDDVDDNNNTNAIISDNNTKLMKCNTKQPTPGRFTNDIIIQHHDLVLTTKDLALGIFCKFDIKNSSIAQIDLQIKGEISTDKLKGTAKLPELSLHLVDHWGNDIDEVSIGDIIRVQIRMSDENTYGIFVRNLIAKDNQNPNNNFTLIDNKGCPSQMKMMREVRLLNENGKTLESYLEAFTFTGGSILVIQVEVETCLDQCKPVQCQVANGRSYSGIEMVTSYGRRRRRRFASLDIDDEVDDDENYGDIVSMTKLSKSLIINKRNEFIADDSNNNYRSKEYNNPISNQTDEIITNYNNKSIVTLEKSSSSSSTTTIFESYQILNKNYLCFEPMNLFIICMIACFIQTTLLLLIFLSVIKMKRCFKNRRIRHQQSPLATLTTEATTKYHTSKISSFKLKNCLENSLLNTQWT